MEVQGQGTNEGKKTLYHCNYCDKDISGKIRIKCAMCSDFDLCVECFSVGAEVYPHKSNHQYKVMDNLSFPLFCADWNADEEILLLEGIEIFGLWNWNEVAEHVGTKSRSQCFDHYNTIYMNSSCFPLPDMSHIMGKNREEVQVMARGRDEVKKGLWDLSVKEESSFPAGIKVEDQSRQGPDQSLSSLIPDVGTGSTNGNTCTGGVKRASSIVQSRFDCDAPKIEDRSGGEKKPRISKDKMPSLEASSGYNSKRQEFEIEYDNDAEQLLADMEFKDTDTDAEREIKLQILHIYGRRLDERNRRKNFILDRNLLHPDPFEKDLSPDEKELCRRFRVFMRFHSKEEHAEFLKTLVEEHRIRRRIQDLKEARAAGCRLSVEAERFIEQKKKREAEEHAHKAKGGSPTGPSGKFLKRTSHLKRKLDNSPRAGVPGSGFDDWNINGLPGTESLSEAEKRLCSEIRILPAHYHKMLETMSMEVMKGTISQKSDAHRLFPVDPSKVDKVYEMLMKKGIAP